MSRPARQLSRRRFLAGAGIGAGWVSLPASLSGMAMTRTLRAAVTASALAPQASFIWSFEGTSPGPLLRVKRGEELRVRLVNELPEPTSIHWHGLRLPNAMDGVPHLTQPPVAPGASFDYVFRPPDAGTFWYHAYSPGQVDRGLHGALIVDEPQAIAVDREVLLVLGEPFERGGSGPTVLVNGSADPDIPVKAGERLRLRLINATSARALSLKVEGHSPWVMALDGQPAEPLVAREGRLALWPGSRIDLFMDATQRPGAAAAILTGSREQQRIARLVYESGGAARAAGRGDPLPLPSNPLPARIDLKNSLKLELVLGGTKPLDPAAPLFTIRRGRAVTLAIRNPGGQPHVMHLHGHNFRLLDRLDDGWKPFWLDTLVVGEPIERIAFVADNPGKWLIASRLLERRDSGSAVWFAVN